MMAKRELASPGETAPVRPARGSVRPSVPYRGELARHRLITADGSDYVVATLVEAKRGPSYLTGAYPVTRGYLVMMRQPLYEIRSDYEATARTNHDRLVSVLAEAGVSIVRAERLLAARRRAEKQEAAANRRQASELPLILTLHGSTPDRDQVPWPSQDMREQTVALT
jgi:hypothetical protein